MAKEHVITLGPRDHDGDATFARHHRGRSGKSGMQGDQVSCPWSGNYRRGRRSATQLADWVEHPAGEAKVIEQIIDELLRSDRGICQTLGSTSLSCIPRCQTALNIDPLSAYNFARRNTDSGQARREDEGNAGGEHKRDRPGVVEQADKGGKRGRLAHRLCRAAQEMQRQQHQADADQSGATALMCGRAAAVEDDTRDDDEWRQPFDVGRDDPGRDRRTGKRAIPDKAPISFAPKGWVPLNRQDGKIDRSAYELYQFSEGWREPSAFSPFRELPYSYADIQADA
jgi:hypothetical protein